MAASGNRDSVHSLDIAIGEAPDGRDESGSKKKANPKGGQRKPREIRELVIEIAKTTGFGYT